MSACQQLSLADEAADVASDLFQFHKWSTVAHVSSALRAHKKGWLEASCQHEGQPYGVAAAEAYYEESFDFLVVLHVASVVLDLSDDLKLTRNKLMRELSEACPELSEQCRAKFLETGRLPALA